MIKKQEEEGVRSNSFPLSRCISMAGIVSYPLNHGHTSVMPLQSSSAVAWLRRELYWAVLVAEAEYAKHSAHHMITQPNVA